MQFSSRVSSILRVMPEAQQKAVHAYAGDIGQGTEDLEDAWKHMLRLRKITWFGSGIEDRFKAKDIVDELAWADLTLDTKSDFKNDRGFATSVSIAAGPLANRFNKKIPKDLRLDSVNEIAIGFIGLHATLLGLPAVSISPGKDKLEAAVNKYERKILFPRIKEIKEAIQAAK